MKKYFAQNLGLKVVSVFLGILIWFLVVQAVDPISSKTISGVMVEVRNPSAITSMDKTYSLDTQSVTLTVYAKKTNLSKITAADFDPYVDLRYAYGNSDTSQAVQVQVDVLNNKDIIDHYTIRNNSVITFSLEDVIEREMNVEVQPVGDISNTYRLNGWTVSPETITVRAPESVMGRVSKVVVQPDVSQLTSDSTTLECTPVVLDAAGQVVADDEMILSTGTVRLDAALYNTNSIPISLEGISGTVAQGYRYNGATLSQDSVIVMGSRTNLASISQIVIPASELSVEGAVSDVVRNIDLTNYLPDGVTISDDSSPTVAVTLKVEALQTRNYSIKTAKISLSGKNYSYKYHYSSDEVSVAVTSLKEDLDTLAEGSIHLSADVSGMEPGLHVVPVSVTFDNPDTYLAAQSVSISIVVEDPSQESEPETDEPETEESTEESTEQETEETVPETEADTEPAQESTEDADSPALGG